MHRVGTAGTPITRYRQAQNRCPTRREGVTVVPAPVPRLLATILLLLATTTGSRAGAAAARDVGYLGVATCASPLCHGAAVVTATHVRQDEYRTWLKKDRHAKAYDVLGGDLGKTIARTLGLGNAQEAPVCLGCHAAVGPNDEHGPRFHPAEGISCEACHGPAGEQGGREGWIVSHTRAGATHADNLARGMYPLDDPAARAKLCLSCHFGTDEKHVDHRMMAAGHPRLVFELETFTQIEPAHFVLDADYTERKPLGATPSEKIWAIGQVVGARAFLDALESPTRSRAGAWPEFTLYDCYSCHQRMRKPGSRERMAASDAALPALGTESLTLVARMLSVVAPASAAGITSKVERLQREVRSLDYGDTVTALRGELDTALAATVAWSSAHGDGGRLLLRIASLGDHPTPLTYAQAEQLTMAVQALAVPRDDVAKGRVGARVDRLFTLTRSDADFDESRFRDALQDLTRAGG